MKLSLILIAILVISAYSVQVIDEDNQQYYKHLESIAKKINQNSSKYNWVANEDLSEYQDLTKESAIRRNGGKSFQDSQVPEFLMPKFSAPLPAADNIPESFDAREQWSKCSSLKEIRNQGSCGSCWSFGGAEAFTDRWCIATGQKETDVRLSTENLVSCCDFCGNGCAGGYNPMVWNYFQESGIVTGNNYGDNDYCQSYSIPPSSHGVNGNKLIGADYRTPKCRYQCDSTYKGDSYGENLYFTKSTGLIINKNLEQIQTEIMTNGPVEVLFYVYEDFYAYKSGVYKHVTGDELGGHAVKMLGWGVENGEPYWLCANSWGTGFGENGFFKILRGENECGIEHEITYGTPDITRNRSN